MVSAISLEPGTEALADEAPLVREVCPSLPRESSWSLGFRLGSELDSFDRLEGSLI